MRRSFQDERGEEQGAGQLLALPLPRADHREGGHRKPE